MARLSQSTLSSGTLGQPVAPSGLTATQGSLREIDLAWTDNSKSETGFEVYRATQSGSSVTDYTLITTVAADTTSFTDTGLLDGEKYYYRVRAINENGSSPLTSEVNAVTQLRAPSSVSLTVNSNKSITVDYPDVINNGQYKIQISRNDSSFSNPASGPTTVNNSTTSVTYSTNSDFDETRVVGIDSKFEFRVRSQTEHTSSSYTLSETEYTDPIPPSQPSFNQYLGAGGREFSWENRSDIVDAVGLEKRVDTGSGYGSWEPAILVNYELYDTGGYYDTNGHPSTTTELDEFFDTSNSGVSFVQDGPWGDILSWSAGRGNPLPESVADTIPGADGFAWKFTGSVYLGESGTYGFAVDGDDACDVFIDGQLVADFYGGHGTAGDFSNNGTITLDAGFHTITARQEEGGGGEALAVGINPPSASSYSVLNPYDYTNSVAFDGLQTDSRYQFRVSSIGGKFGDRSASDHIYLDYGNEGDVYFEDDFEDNDLAEWDATNLSGDTGVRDGSGPADLQVSGADSGQYYFYGEGVSNNQGTFIEKNLGDLSSETDILIQCSFAIASLDDAQENFGISWYDGSSWTQIESFEAEYNRQDWFEVAVVVPDNLLSSDNRVRFGTTTSTGMFGGDQFAIDRVVVSDILHEYTQPAVATGVSAATGSSRHEIDVSWTDTSTPFPQAFYEVRTRVAGTTNSFEKISVDPTVSSETIKPNEGFSATVARRDGEQYELRVDSAFEQYREGSTDRFHKSTSLTTTAITPFQSPTNADLVYVSDSQLDADWNDTADFGEYQLQINRNNNGYVTPAASSSGTAPSVGTTTTSFGIDNVSGAGSATDFDGSVGIDSQFEFRVRHRTEHGSGDWQESNTTFTTPLPPEPIDVRRPDANTVEIDYRRQSLWASHVSIRAREDTGSGFTNIGEIEHNTNVTRGTTFTATFDTTGTLQTDARYQFRLETHEYEDVDLDGTNERNASEEVYADFGNIGNVYFEDDFSSGDASAWDGNSISTGGVTTSLNNTFAETGPEVGGSAVEMGDAGFLTKNLGDLSGESDVHVRVSIQTASNDFSGETGDVQWYDGSSWQVLRKWGPEYDQRGWMTYHVEVPSDLLSSDARIRVGRDEGGGGDYVAFDRVVVSDKLNEYTRPASPSGLSLDASVEDEITASWTLNNSITDAPANVETFIRELGGSFDSANRSSSLTSVTFSNLVDGRDYEIGVTYAVNQYRRGSKSTEWDSGGTQPTITQTAETVLPEVANVSVDTSSLSGFELSWNKQDDNPNGHVEVYRSTTPGSLGSAISGQLSPSTTSFTDTNVSQNQPFYYTIRRVT